LEKRRIIYTTLMDSYMELVGVDLSLIKPFYGRIWGAVEKGKILPIHIR